MEKHSTYMLAKIELSDSESIIELANFFKTSYHDFGEQVFEVCISLLERMIDFSKKKEMKEILDLIIDEAIGVLEGEDLLFISHAYVLANNYNLAYEENVDFYEKVIYRTDFHKKNDFYSACLFVNLSLSYNYLKNYDEAIKVLERNNQVRIQLGVNYELAGKVDKAISIYKGIIKNSDDKDDFIHAHFNLFELYKNQGDFSKAKKILEEIEPEFLLTDNNNYKVTRSFLLHDYYKKLGNRVKTFRYLKMAALEYEAEKDIDIANKIEALKAGILGNKFSLPDILETYSKYKQFADSELINLLERREVTV
ncbi:hypothetical protein PM10SUCC1_32620 [Propionigenium maris DSM 9537]|uniref:Tetratricopeptide repeat-containing protein n=1 Tax=Propionigenium maris DSM 9537 TaxID=1123000 RepID=A0A9W6GNE7_9FUSO|nr:tetratricopeptide repeat protein [Propionigenium maris]GLI57748.1 hypothetical protein PM10SUCC1_32620 [Propionigenium maris DSM 9537]